MRRRLFSALSLVALSSVTTLGCPQPLREPVGEAQWQKVASSPAGESAEARALRVRARRNAAEAKVKKMRAAFVLEEERTCAADAECTLTPQQCCTCSAGGRMDAVRADKLPELIKRRSVICQNYACPQMVSTHPSCQATSAVCRNGKCEVDRAGQDAAETGLGVETIPPAAQP